MDLCFTYISLLFRVLLGRLDRQEQKLDSFMQKILDITVHRGIIDMFNEPIKTLTIYTSGKKKQCIFKIAV